MQNTLPDALDIPSRLAHVIQFGGQGILDVLVLAAPAFEDQLHLDLVLFPLLEVDHRRVRAQVIPRVLTRQRVHRIRAELAALGRLDHRLLNRLPDLDLIHPHRRVHMEGRHAGVLADRPLPLLRHIDIGGDDVQRLGGLRPRRLGFDGLGHRLAHVGRQIRRGLGDQFNQAFFKELHGE